MNIINGVVPVKISNSELSLAAVLVNSEVFSNETIMASVRNTVKQVWDIDYSNDDIKKVFETVSNLTGEVSQDDVDTTQSIGLSTLLAGMMLKAGDESFASLVGEVNYAAENAFADVYTAIELYLQDKNAAATTDEGVTPEVQQVIDELNASTPPEVVTEVIETPAGNLPVINSENAVIAVLQTNQRLIGAVLATQGAQAEAIQAQLDALTKTVKANNQLSAVLEELQTLQGQFQELIPPVLISATAEVAEA